MGKRLVFNVFNVFMYHIRGYAILLLRITRASIWPRAEDRGELFIHRQRNNEISTSEIHKVTQPPLCFVVMAGWGRGRRGEEGLIEDSYSCSVPDFLCNICIFRHLRQPKFRSQKSAASFTIGAKMRCRRYVSSVCGLQSSQMLQIRLWLAAAKLPAPHPIPNSWVGGLLDSRPLKREGREVGWRRAAASMSLIGSECRRRPPPTHHQFFMPPLGAGGDWWRLRRSERLFIDTYNQHRKSYLCRDFAVLCRTSSDFVGFHRVKLRIRTPTRASRPLRSLIMLTLLTLSASCFIPRPTRPPSSPSLPLIP